jgi:hypothetical protein
MHYDLLQSEPTNAHNSLELQCFNVNSLMFWASLAHHQGVHSYVYKTIIQPFYHLQYVAELSISNML